MKSLSRPEGNVTGITSLNVYVAPKRVELMHELLPKAKAFAVLVNPANPTTAEMAVKGLEGPSRALGLQLHFLNASTEKSIPRLRSWPVWTLAGSLSGPTFFSTAAHNSLPL